MQQYLDLLSRVQKEGKRKKTRTGIDAYSITGAMFEHDMTKGFPLLTTKKMGLKNIATELVFFNRGLSDKSWLQERGCHIWDEWANPQVVPYSTDPAVQQRMKQEPDLGRIYGVQWRDWRGAGHNAHVDQLANAIDTLRKDPSSRRIIVSAWNPAELGQMALPPCHYSFQLLSDGETLDLLWNQRSVDTPLGLPYNIASYALQLRLIAAAVGMAPGKLIGFLADVHIYENQMEGVEEQLSRKPLALPMLGLALPLPGSPQNSFDFFGWEPGDFVLRGYEPYPAIRFPIAV